jgi:hypothetical protein
MKPGASMWFAVAGFFALMGCAWAAMFFFAGRAKIETVPLPGVHREAR